MIKIAFLFVVYFTPNSILSQEIDNKVSFIVKFDENKATKDGYYLDNYVVNISPKRAFKLIGKTIKITGKYQIIKGLKPLQKEYNIDNKEIQIQGRQNDIKYISSPKIEIIKE